MGKSFNHKNHHSGNDNEDDSAESVPLIDGNGANPRQQSIENSAQLSPSLNTQNDLSSEAEVSAKYKREQNGFRTLFSRLRKWIEEFVGKKKLHSQVKKIFSEFSRSSDKSTFCVLYHIAEKYRVENLLMNRFINEYGLVIDAFGEWSTRKSRVALEWAQRIRKAFWSESVEDQLKAIWADRPKSTKIRACKKKVKDYIARIRKIPNEA